MKTIQRKRPQRFLAKQAGLSTYYTGKPCKHGHDSPRNTSDASCVKCRELFRLSYRQEAREYAKTYRKELRDAIGDAAYRDMINEQKKQYRSKNPERVRKHERRNGRLRRQRHPQAKNADNRARQLAKIQRTPSWADLVAIKQFYKNCPVGYVVDHVIPLRGQNVSGLHVLSNLQYLTPEENLAKGNRYAG